MARATPKKVAVALVVLLLIIWGTGRLFAWSACSWYGYQTERTTRYAAFIGCMVEVEGKWIPRAELRTPSPL
jgi:hypothetical protein